MLDYQILNIRLKIGVKSSIHVSHMNLRSILILNKIKKIDLVLLLPAVPVFTWSMLQVICLKVSDSLRRCLIANLYLTVSITLILKFSTPLMQWLTSTRGDLTVLLYKLYLLCHHAYKWISFSCLGGLIHRADIWMTMLLSG